MTKTTSHKSFIFRSFIIVLAACFITAFALPVQASSTCSVRGCKNNAVGGSSYCSDHKCKVDGCKNKATNKGYCSKHKSGTSTGTTTSKSSKTCAVNGCNKTAVKGGNYCTDHTCKEKNCYNQKNKKALYCTAHLKGRMPDCDDYDDFDEFMDDWDGKMPDGSDAEDYWENW